MDNDKEGTQKATERYGNLCRLCGETGKESMMNIFDNELDILEKINSFIPIVILQFDDLPKKICNTCSNHVTIATDLIMKAYKTDRCLKMFKTNPNLNPDFNLPLSGPVICDICDAEYVNMKQFDIHMEKHKNKSNVQKVGTADKIIQICCDCGFGYDENDKYLKHKLLSDVSCKDCGSKILSECSKFNHTCNRSISKLKPSTNKNIVIVKTKIPPETQKLLENRDEIPSLNRNSRLKYGKKEIHTKNGKSEKYTKPMKLDKLLNGNDETTLELYPLPENLVQQDMVVVTTLPNKPPWKCSFCSKVVTTKLSLRVHERIHLGIKPYICEHCGEGFRSRANLTQHLPVHTDIRKYSCPICSKKFARKSFVRIHLRVHTGEKPYSCDLCGCRFTQVGDMRRHRKRHVANNKLYSDR